MTVEPIELFAPARLSVIRVSLMEVSPEYYPSFQLGLDIVDETFTGSGTVWVAISEWQTFLSGLLECERTRRGTTNLCEMREWDSFLAINGVNSLGHFVVQYRLTYRETSLSGTFPLDTEFFGQIVSGFKRLDEAVSDNNR